MALGIFEVREIVERVFAQQDVLDACARRDLGRVIMILGAQGLTQGRISELTGISQGRLSEWASRKRKPRASSVFEAFADGLGLPPAARQALGLAFDSPGEPGLAQPCPDRDRIAPPHAQALQLDATDGTQVKETVRQLGATHGHIDALVNVAGGMRGLGMLHRNDAVARAPHDERRHVRREVQAIGRRGALPAQVDDRAHRVEERPPRVGVDERGDGAAPAVDERRLELEIALRLAAELDGLRAASVQHTF